MSKAFTRESDSGADEQIAARPAFSLPPGTKNYLTPDGARRLNTELAALIGVERPAALTLADRKRELADIDQRIAYLQQSLGTAEIVHPTNSTDGKVRFGATITVRDATGVVSQYRIVGIDEMDVDRNWVSWRSPVAKALINKRIGDRVKFAVPEGQRSLEILAVTCDSA